MSLILKKFAEKVVLVANHTGLFVESLTDVNWGRPETWPQDVLSSSFGTRTAYEIASLLEMGLAEVDGKRVQLDYSNFEAIQKEDFKITNAFTQASPFLLKIDRRDMVGQPQFSYRYSYMLGGSPVSVNRFGFYVERPATNHVYCLDGRMFALVEAMDDFNSLPPEEKTPQRAWMDFANIKRWAKEVHAALDATLLKNDVIVPSSIGLDLYEDQDGALSFIPVCAELENAEFRAVFVRNTSAEGLYSLDRPGLGRVRIVLTEKQQRVLETMKRVHRVTGEEKAALKADPSAVFDGIMGDVELHYGDRVLGIGPHEFLPTPRPWSESGPMSGLFGEDGPGGQGSSTRGEGAKASNVLLIDTHDDLVGENYRQQSENARLSIDGSPFKRPGSLRATVALKRHQEQGVQWLQTCAKINDRRGVLLADDMGVGKTLQILSFLAWCIESGRFPDLSKPKPPFRPILIVAPLILLETETWEKEMKAFFADNGEVFGGVLPLYGAELQAFRRRDAEGRESQVAKPILNLDRIQRHQVVITNYEAVRDYMFSFAYCPNGKSIWSIVITDEAQEYKTPNSKISYAIKALQPDFRIACTGTPVENRLLDMWNLIDAGQPGLLGSARHFVAKYESPLDRKSSEQALADLKSRLLYQRPNAFLLRRSKAEVLELPPKSEKRIRCSMSDDEIAKHLSLAGGLRGVSREDGKLAVLQKFARLYQHPSLLEGTGDDFSVAELKAQSSKIREVLAVLRGIEAQREKAIVFARHKDVQRMLARILTEEFEKPVRIVNGDTPKAGSSRRLGAETRNSILNGFRESAGFDMLVLSPFVAGVGLTIVEANHVIHYGRWWNPAVEAQATDRVYRLGQPKPVHVYLPILEDKSGRIRPSFDQLLDALMEGKKGIASGALQKDDFPMPQATEAEAGLQVFSELERSV